MGGVNKRIAVQDFLGKKCDPIQKITKAKRTADVVKW
jgi:hypothetical protein